MQKSRFLPVTLLSALLGVFILAGCVTTSHRTTPHLVRSGPSQSILLMPMDIELSSLTAGGMLKPEAQWTADAKANVEEAIERRMKWMDVDVLSPGEAEKVALNEEERSKREQLIKLHEVVGNSIMLHQYVLKLPGKQERFDWSLGPGAAFLKEKLGADYALFVYLRDSYATAGRVGLGLVSAALGVNIPMGQQVGFASLVDLRSGDVVWFNRLARAAGDLRTQKAAAESVSHLLADFPKGAGAEDPGVIRPAKIEPGVVSRHE